MTPVAIAPDGSAVIDTSTPAGITLMTAPTTGSTTLRDLATQAAIAAGIDPGLFRALVQQESAWNPNAISKAGAQGLVQLMPATAQQLGVTNPFDPIQSLNAGAKYLASLINQFGSVSLGLAAYNAGPGNVQKYGGIPPFAETMAYVAKITAMAPIS
jgi:soluble lytic murein transglycosylase-like protein